MKDQDIQKMVFEFSLTHKVGNGEIFVQVLVEINCKQVTSQFVSMQIYIYHIALNNN